MVHRSELEERCLGFDEPDRCVVRNHLRSGVPYCFGAEPIDADVLERAGGEPVVVVDSHLRPLGVLQNKAGADGLLAKPVTAEALEEAIEEILAPPDRNGSCEGA